MFAKDATLIDMIFLPLALWHLLCCFLIHPLAPFIIINLGGLSPSLAYVCQASPPVLLSELRNIADHQGRSDEGKFTLFPSHHIFREIKLIF